MPAKPRLSEETLAQLPPSVPTPVYDRRATLPGIVHFGPGAFLRAHIGSYLEALLRNDPRWGIAGLALRAGAQAADLARQDYLYVLAELDEPARYRVIGAMKDYVVAPADRARAFACLANPAARIVTITVTEKGYCFDADGRLDFSHSDIVHDLARPEEPTSLIGWLAEGLFQRRARGLPDLIVMSCDNVASNGPKLRKAVAAYAEALGRKEQARWIEAEMRFPATMVDSITPASDEALRIRVAEATGLYDAAPVQRESFRQWVIEDDLGADAPDLTSVGAQLTLDVRAYEQAKLRILNGAHSALAYLGLQFGYVTVDEAMRDAQLAAFVERLMRDDIAPTLRPTQGLDVQDYIGSVLKRLRNPAVSHRLTQISADGSLKLRYRFLEPITDLLDLGRSIARPSVPVAAWMRFVRGAAMRGEALSDPLAAKLLLVGAQCTGVPAEDVARFLEVRDVFPNNLAGEPSFATALVSSYGDLRASLL